MKPSYRRSWAGNLLMFSDLTLGPPSRSNDGSLALVSCIFGGYKLASVLNIPIKKKTLHEITFLKSGSTK